MNLAGLKAPFQPGDLDWRIQSSGVKNNKPWAIVLCYVDARAVQNRLDEVCGPENWKANYRQLEGGVMCTLSIRVGDQWVDKEDGSPETKVEAFKGGISKALVRAASAWGVGRYLYGLGDSFATFVEQRTDETRSVKIGEQYFHWLPPRLPPWALPATGARPAAPATAHGPTETKAPQDLDANRGQPTLPQIKSLFAMMSAAKWTEAQMREYMGMAFRVDSTKKLTATQLVDFYEVLKKKTKFEDAMTALEREP